MTEEKKAIIIRNLYKTYKLERSKKKFLFKKKKEKYLALSNINLIIDKGQCLGIIGPNGSGKTTLLKLIAGILKPTEGSIKKDGKVLSFLGIGSGFLDELTGRENIYLYGKLLGIAKKDIKTKIKKIIGFSQLGKFIDVKLKNYSSGMKARLAFSIAMVNDLDIILIDEVLTVGDQEFQKKCFSQIELYKKLGKTIVIVSHDLGLIKSICNKAVLLINGKIHDSGIPQKVILTYLDKLRKKQNESVHMELEEKYTELNHSIKNKQGFYRKKAQILTIINSIYENIFPLSNISEHGLDKKEKEIIKKEIELGKKAIIIKKDMINRFDKDDFDIIRLIFWIEYKNKLKSINSTLDLYQKMILSTLSVKQKLELIDEMLMLKLDKKGRINNKFIKIIPAFSKFKIKKISSEDSENYNYLITKIIKKIRKISYFLKIEKKEAEDVQIEKKIEKKIKKLREFNNYISHNYTYRSVKKNKDIKINSVKFLDENNKERTEFESGEKIKIRIKYEFKKIIIEPVFSVEIFSEEGLLINGQDTKSHEIKISKKKGKGELEYVIENIDLLEGNYFISIKIYSLKNIKKQTHHEKMYFVEIRSDKKNQLGILYSNNKWNIIK